MTESQRRAVFLPAALVAANLGVFLLSAQVILSGAVNLLAMLLSHKNRVVPK